MDAAVSINLHFGPHWRRANEAARSAPNSANTNHVVVPIDPGNAAVFYRLAFP